MRAAPFVLRMRTDGADTWRRGRSARSRTYAQVIPNTLTSAMEPHSPNESIRCGTEPDSPSHALQQSSKSYHPHNVPSPFPRACTTPAFFRDDNEGPKRFPPHPLSSFRRSISPHLRAGTNVRPNGSSKRRARLPAATRRASTHIASFSTHTAKCAPSCTSLDTKGGCPDHTDMTQAP